MTMPETDRLIFRPWTKGDLSNAFQLWGDAEVMAFIGGKLSDQQVKVKIENEMSCLQIHGMQYWPMYSKSDRTFIGCCGLKPWVYSTHGNHELGFHLLKEALGKGYAIEAANGVIKFASHRKITCLMAGHHPDNSNSKKVLEKLGFKFVESVFFPPTGLAHPSYRLSLL
jgi:ribosomal-protein-alanine N-acetyltransferase